MRWDARLAAQQTKNHIIWSVQLSHHYANCAIITFSHISHHMIYIHTFIHTYFKWWWMLTTGHLYKNCIMICNMGNGQLVKISSFLAVVLCWPGSRPKQFERNKWQEWETDIEVHGYAYLLQNIFYSNYMSSCPVHNTVSVMTCGLCVMSYMSKWNSPCNFIF